MPFDDGVVLPKNVQMKPLFSKSNLNFKLNVTVLVGAGGSNGFPGGHANLDGGHPGLMKHPFEGVTVTEVPLAPLRPKIIKKKTT
jgi:hypothetical protein